MAIATIVKSWPGLMRMCKPDGSGLQSLLGVLYLPNMETRASVSLWIYKYNRTTIVEFLRVS